MVSKAVVGTAAAVVAFGLLNGTSPSSGAAAGSISGTVMSFDSQPAQRTRVTAYRTSPEGVVAVSSTHTSLQGMYRLDGLLPGKYQVGFWSGDTSDIESFYPAVATLGRAQAVHVDVDATVAGIDGIVDIDAHRAGADVAATQLDPKLRRSATLQAKVKRMRTARAKARQSGEMRKSRRLKRKITSRTTEIGDLAVESRLYGAVALRRAEMHELARQLHELRAERRRNPSRRVRAALRNTENRLDLSRDALRQLGVRVSD